MPCHIILTMNSIYFLIYRRVTVVRSFARASPSTSTWPSPPPHVSPPCTSTRGRGGSRPACTYTGGCTHQWIGLYFPIGGGISAFFGIPMMCVLLSSTLTLISCLHVHKNHKTHKYIYAYSHRYYLRTRPKADAIQVSMHSHSICTTLFSSSTDLPSITRP